MSSNKTYVIMKNGVKIKTTKSLNSAKVFADQEQAEVFCNGEKVYSGMNTSNPSPSDEREGVQEDIPIDEKPSHVSPASPVSPVSDDKDDKPQEQKSTEEQNPTVPTDQPTEELKEQPEAEPKAYRIKALMNVREAPSLTAKIVAVAESGKIVNVYDIKNDWMKVKWYDGFAYILYKNGEFAEPARG